MSRILLVRHGRAAAGFGAAADPGLDALGQAQSTDVATVLAARSPAAVLTSPLRRARETAAPLEALLARPARVEARIAEIPSPTTDLAARARWLPGVMGGLWSRQDAHLRAWADGVIACLLELPSDSALFSHFIAINVAVAFATGDDRVTCFRPDNCSVTEFTNDGGRLTLIARGREAATHVN